MIAVTGRTKPRRQAFYVGQIGGGVWRVAFKPKTGKTVEATIAQPLIARALETAYLYDRDAPNLFADRTIRVTFHAYQEATRLLVKNPRPDAKPDGGTAPTSEPEGSCEEDSGLPEGVQPFPACPTCKDPSEVYLHEDGRYFVCGQCGRSFVDDPALSHRCAECDYRVEPLGRKGRCSSCGGLG